MSDIVFDPLMPLLALQILTGLVALFFVLGLVRAPRSAFLRLPAMLALLTVLAGPHFLEKTVSTLPNIALVVVDESASQSLDRRADVTAESAAELGQRLEAMGNLEIIRMETAGEGETRLFEALRTGLAAVPRQQLAGIFILSDGLATDPQLDAARLGIEAPVHFLSSGREDEKDRVLEIISAPRYGIINETAEIKFRVNDIGTGRETALVQLLVNGEEIVRRPIESGREMSLKAPLKRPGKTVIELIAGEVDGELTPRNNRAVVQIFVIRDRLRVLLVSGEPHAGERTWRNLLKSDPAVDLIHFTILKPATKQRVVPADELSLIQFPDDELFLEKLDQFDVLIFDRYTYRGVMTPIHFDNIARFIENGGAMLISSGPEFIGRASLAARRNLAYILPALPDGSLVEMPYLPELNDNGRRHPVTAPLGEEAAWGRWMRLIGTDQRSGQTLMTGPEGAPLLILDRKGDGRVALLNSDHVWLWARGFDGGGPHRELLRRLVHWLMKEPELEEEALRLDASEMAEGFRLTTSLRSMQDEPALITMTGADGESWTVDVEAAGIGQWRGSTEVTRPGLYSVTAVLDDGRRLFDIAAAGLAAPPEFADVLSSDVRLLPLIDETAGGVHALRRDASAVQVPSLRYVPDGNPAAGRGRDRGWAGLYDRKAERVEAVASRPLMPRWAWLAIGLVTLLLAWLGEGGIGLKRLFRRN